jgi:hypothetical protein
MQVEISVALFFHKHRQRRNMIEQLKVQVAVSGQRTASHNHGVLDHGKSYSMYRCIRDICDVIGL